jgi:hypothetical protein
MPGGVRVSACYLEIHPLANLFPKRSEERIRALAQDMRENGQRDKITPTRANSWRVATGTGPA